MASQRRLLNVRSRTRPRASEAMEKRSVSRSVFQAAAQPRHLAFNVGFMRGETPWLLAAQPGYSINAAPPLSWTSMRQTSVVLLFCVLALALVASVALWRMGDPGAPAGG